jgi:archaellum component FlaF (FlaF/FlaG flagellin family)
MRVSLAAGLVFLLVLGIVFVPRALEWGEVQPPAIALVASGEGPYVVTVSRVSRAYALSQYRATLNATNGSAVVSVDMRPVAANGSWAGGTIAFSDADADAILSAGDRFTIEALSGTGWTYEIFVFYVPRDAGAKPPCPCAAGHADFGG